MTVSTGQSETSPGETGRTETSGAARVLSLPQHPSQVRKAVLTINGGAYRYADGTLALRNVDLCVHRGEHVAILGPSGGGKTTLLGLISGRLRLCAGSMSREGKVATVHQDLRLVSQSSVLTNVLHGALPRRRWWGFTPQDKSKARALLDRVGLADKADVPVGRLSGGQKQRVAVARALMSDPEILLADEPVAALDARTAREVMGLIDRLRLSRGLTLVTVLHDRELADEFADRTVELDAGWLGERQPPIGPATTPDVRADPREMKPFPAWGWWVVGVLLLGAYAGSLSGFEITSRQTQDLLPNLADFARRLVPTARQFVSAPWGQFGSALLETLRMALLGTTLAAALSLPMAALAARNVAPAWLRLPSRVLLNVLRAVPSIVWALLMVAALGLGPVAGVIALAAYSMGYLTKFFYEAIESVDPATLSALQELGASRWQRLAYGVFPAARATLAGSAIFMLEYNVRAASVLGLVGAGGLGYELKLHLDYGNLHNVGIVLGILVAVTVVLDTLSARLRERVR